MITTTIDNEISKQLEPEYWTGTKEEDNDVLVLILTSNLNMLAPQRVVGEQLIFGKRIIDWVVASAGEHRTKIINYNQNDNILALIKPHLGAERTTIVIYDDTPLLRRATLEQLLQDFDFKGQKVKKLPRGYIFDTEYIRDNDKIYVGDMEDSASEDFMCVNSTNALCIATMKLKNRIISYHISNGVMILDPNAVYIDADVEIGSGVIIYPNNNLMGASKISENVTLLPNNTLLDCAVDKNCVLLGCNLEKVRVQESSKLKFLTKSNNITNL